MTGSREKTWSNELRFGMREITHVDGRRLKNMFEATDALNALEAELEDYRARAELADEMSAQITRDGEASGGIPWAWYMRWRTRYDAIAAPSSDTGSEESPDAAIWAKRCFDD